MSTEWENVGTERNPRIEHLHQDGKRSKTDRTIPMLRMETGRPRLWHATFVCRECQAALDREWQEGA
jgi:hypothetical protein